VATWGELLTELREDILKDTDTAPRWSNAQLLRMANGMIRQSFPLVFEYASDATTETELLTGRDSARYTKMRYSLPSAIPDRRRVSPLYRVEWGPIGGQRNSDSGVVSDEWTVVRSGMGDRRAWDVDWSRRELVLHWMPPTDATGTYDYFIRMSYIRPLAELETTDSELEGPENYAQVLLELIRMRCIDSNMRPAQAEPPRLEGLGQQQNLLRDRILDLLAFWGIRMQPPRVEA
jgi:hypothetical protein